MHALFSSLPLCYQYQCNWLSGKIRPGNDLLCVEWDIKPCSAQLNFLHISQIMDDVWTATDSTSAEDLLCFEEQRPTEASAEERTAVLQGGWEKLDSRRLLTPQSKCIVSILYAELSLNLSIYILVTWCLHDRFSFDFWFFCFNIASLSCKGRFGSCLKLWSRCYTRAISEHPKDKQLIYIALYKFSSLLYFPFSIILCINSVHFVPGVVGPFVCTSVAIIIMCEYAPYYYASYAE